MCLECVKLGYMQVYHAITTQTHNRIYYHNIIRLVVPLHVQHTGYANIVIAIAITFAATATFHIAKHHIK